MGTRDLQFLFDNVARYVERSNIRVITSAASLIFSFAPHGLPKNWPLARGVSKFIAHIHLNSCLPKRHIIE